jgi:hypothetical protein
MAADDKPAESAGDGKPDAPPRSNDGTSGRNRSRRGRRGASTTTSYNTGTTSRHIKFEGSCEGLKGHVYDVLDHRQADAFAKTTKELALYAGKTLKEGDDVRLAVLNLALPVLDRPTQPLDPDNEYQKMDYMTDLKIHRTRVAQMASNMRSLFSLIIGQCSESMINKLESTNEFKTISDSSDSIELLKAIKKVSFHYESQKYGPLAMHNAFIMFCTCRQDECTTIESYLETFNNTVAIVNYAGGKLGTAPELGNMLARERGLNIDTMSAADARALRLEAQD